jgi:hypothetical protein
MRRMRTMTNIMWHYDEQGGDEFCDECGQALADAELEAGADPDEPLQIVCHTMEAGEKPFWCAECGAYVHPTGEPEPVTE